MFFDRDRASSTTRKMWSGYVSVLLLTTAAGASLATGGCSSEGPAPSASAAVDAGTPGLLSSTSACTRGEPAKLSFSTTLECSANGACALDHLTLDATSETDPATVGATTTWTIHGDAGPLVRETVRSLNGKTSGDFTFGPEVHGPAHTTFDDDGSTMTWTMDGRTARASHGGPHPGRLAFADGGGQPEIALSAETRAAISRLLDQARADASVACAGSLAVAGLQAALPSSSPATQLAQPARPKGGVRPVAPVGEGHVVLPPPNPTPIPSPNPNPPPVPLTAGTPAEVAGESPDFEGSTQQNNVIDWVTPSCQSCQSSCVENVACQITPGCVWACSAGCLIPGAGCAQQVCPLQNGYGTCDSNETCCGGICCGPGTVCGDPSLGICCPASDPVACGDQTQQWCYAAGTQCCSNADACPAGTQCTNVTGTSATCCPPAQTATTGQCCEKDACNGQCCDTGSCVNGSCCVGQVVNGQCCGLADTVCGGACCTGSCTGNGGCCASENAVCGNACCGGGEVCIDASTSTCGVPMTPVLTLSDSTGVLGRSGGAAIRVIAGNPYTLSGQGWAPGTVSLEADHAVTGPRLGSATASGGATTSTFSTTVTFNLSAGVHEVIAMEARGSTTSLSWIDVNVAYIQ